MPDRYIHSSDDDLWAIDRTQLQRNAVAVALIAHTMDTADSAAGHQQMSDRCGEGSLTPCAGRELFGRVRATLAGGRLAFGSL